MSKLKKLLAEYESVLQKYNPLALVHLLPPLSDEEIKKYMTELGVHDEQFMALYQWKNGSVDDDFSYLFDGHIQPINDIPDFYKWLVEEEPDGGYKGWNKNLVPIILYDGDIISFNKEKGEHYGKIYLYSVPLLFINEPISFYDSIEAMITTNIEAYKNGGLVYNNQSKILESDLSKIIPKGYELNPKSDYIKLLFKEM